ncbi:PA-phosphatase [Niastella yeongjuensis]|uniref:PA-phosphatase n=1 Tax=Niastella yeongjuensis TaxID=354355 RepID=A0A1V9EXB7_9BACT|nr:phosphatase PAP2 family protein [Niastella yeongjuensis]OQP50767.1 PA-phosphatase [Niastella yeongjuensis]SEN18907.1 PAP2 superfamily protein [Niastella yeongjuensis]
MKKLLYYTLPLLVIATVLVPFACSKTEKGRTDDLPALQPDKSDLEAGSWKPILLTSANEFSISAPIATNTPEYIAQMNEIKSWQASLTDEEKNLVKYWSAGAVLRWNEILRELVAKHNLPPYQNEDGTYPVPNANNPLAYPQFPFANPPYAARAYAYVSAAQYDALVAAYYYKKLYNRPAPYKVDATINVLVPQTDLPAYPSEDAVVAGAAVEMMKLLFPGDQEYIQQKAEEHKRARIIAGANVRSDIEAGEALGKAVAQKFVTRARGDRAGTAGGTPTDWAKLETDCIARGETPWYSLEVPKRPPMLPLFGKVKAFLFDSLTAISLRPGPPPLTASKKMQDETDEIYSLTQNDTRDHYRIVHYWADGAGTSTPSGHWDAIAAEDFIKKNYSEVRWARNMALLNMSLMDAAIVCWDAKYFYFNPRPCQLNPKIKTLTGVPNFPAYISGHSTFSGAAATILSYIIPDQSATYDALAREASLSRMYAGIHYRADCEVGLETGKKVGDYAVDRGKADGAGN